MIVEPFIERFTTAVESLSELLDCLWSFSTVLNLWDCSQRFSTTTLTPPPSPPSYISAIEESQSSFPSAVENEHNTPPYSSVQAKSSEDEDEDFEDRKLIEDQYAAAQKRKDRYLPKKDPIEKEPNSTVSHIFEPPPPYLDDEYLTLKLVIVGDGACGKTWALVSFHERKVLLHQVAQG